MLFKWFPIFRYADFIATGLVSRTYTVDLEGIGERDVLVTRGDLIGLVYDDVFLPLNLNGEEITNIEGYAAAMNPEGWVFLGFPEAVQ